MPVNAHTESTDDVEALQKQLEEANLARQKHAEERNQLIVQVETLQRQLAELIEAKVGLEKEKKLLLAGGVADSQCSTPGAPQGSCSTPPQSSLKRTSRSFTSAQLEEWEKLQLRIQKAERALEHERMVTSELQRLVDSHRAAALFGKTARASYDQLMGELVAAQKECAHQQQQADALRAAMNASDHTAAQLRQELAELMQAKQLPCIGEDSIKEKLKEAEKAADEQCVALAALVDQLVQENLDLGAKLNAKSAALTKARSETSQMQAKVAVLEAAAAHQQSNASSSLAQDPQDRNTHTAITISDSAAGAGPRPLESRLPGGLSDTQWQLLMLSEEVARLTQQLADLQGPPTTKAPAGQIQACALSTSKDCNGGEKERAAHGHSCVYAPTSAVAAGAAASKPALEESVGGKGTASNGGLSIENGAGGEGRERFCKGAEGARQGMAACRSGTADTQNPTEPTIGADMFASSTAGPKGVDASRGAGGLHLEPAEDGVSGSRSTGAGLPSVNDDLGPRHRRQPSLKHPMVELHLPPAELQQRVSELAVKMMELEEQVEAELAKRKRREQLQEEQRSQVSAKDLEGVSAAAPTHRSNLPAAGNSSEPGTAVSLLQPHDQHTVSDTQQQNQQQSQPHGQPAPCLQPPLSSEEQQPALSLPPNLQQHHYQQQQQQQSQFQGQPALPALPHLPVPSNLWERRLSRSLSVASLSGHLSNSPPLDSCGNSNAVHVPNGLSVEVGEGGGELDPADLPFVQQVLQIDHNVHHRQPHCSYEDGLQLSDNEDDDEEMLKRGRGAKHTSSHTRKGGWGLWSWLAGGG